MTNSVTDAAVEAAWKAYSNPGQYAGSKYRMRAALEAYNAHVEALTPPPVADVDEEMHQIGYREGYEDAVQDIDQKTGGDGEYRYCTDHDPDRHTPGPAEMIQRIVDRFEVLNFLDEAIKDGSIEPDDGGITPTPASELVTVAWTWNEKTDNPTFANRYIPRFAVHWSTGPKEQIELVTREQAEAIIASKDAEIADLEQKLSDRFSFTSDDDALNVLERYGHRETGNGIVKADIRALKEQP